MHEPWAGGLTPEVLFDRAPVAYSVVDLEGNQVAGNRAYAALMGYDLDEIPGMTVAQITHPDDRHVTTERRDQVLRGEADTYTLEKRYLRRDGTWFWGRLRATSLRDEQGRPEYLLGVITDITEHRQALEAMAGVERRVRKMLASVGDTVTVIDPGGQVRGSTGEEKEILGYPSSYWETASAFDLAHPDDLDEARRLLVHAIEHPGEEVEARFRARHADGYWVDVAMTAVNLIDDPDIGGLVLTTRNISDLVAAQAEATAARDAALALNDAKTAFVANTSHELRTPLHAIGGLAEVLIDSGLDDEQRLVATSIRREAASLQGVLDDLLDFSKIDAGHIAIEPTPFSPAELADQLQSLFENHAHQHGLALRYLVHRDVPAWCLGDPARIRQILVNLLGNAIKFTESGEIELEVDTADGAVVFRVADTGQGMDEDLVARVFEPFVQGATTPNRHGGAGLGLSIARELADLMGGTIDVSSLVGTGTTFTVTLPLPACEAPRLDDPAEPTSVGPLQGRVLVVEDHPANQLLVTRQLGNLGLEPVVVGEGGAALELLESQRFDLVLMDWHMPGMDGLEATRQIRSRERATQADRLPIIGLTASAMPTDRARCMDAGMDDVLPKPVTRRDLETMLARWLAAPAPATDVTTPTTADAPEAAAPAPTEAAVLDAAVLDALAEDLDDVAVVAAILEAFLEDLPGRTDEITTALEGDEPVRRYRAAHTLRSPASMIGAHALAELCAHIERRSSREEEGIALGPGAASALAHDLRALSEETEAAVRALPPPYRPAGGTP